MFCALDIVVTTTIKT